MRCVYIGVYALVCVPYCVYIVVYLHPHDHPHTLLPPHPSTPPNTLSTRVTLSDNGITNGIEVYEAPSGPLRLATSNNDCKLRVFDVESQQSMRYVLGCWCLLWCVGVCVSHAPSHAPTLAPFHPPSHSLSLHPPPSSPTPLFTHPPLHPSPGHGNLILPSITVQSTNPRASSCVLLEMIPMPL